MKKALKIISLSVLTSVSLAGAVMSTLAWYYERANLNQEIIRGSSSGAYFAYGDGSADHPFGINHPRHLYNLSWLTMDGYFGTNTVYFELDPELENGVLNCEGYVIPPIGTSEHPFYGNFDGNGCTITNLTVTNDTSEITSFGKYPYNAFTSAGTNSAIWPETTPQIVGLFGVVGSISTPDQAVSTTKEIFDLGIDGVTIHTISSQTLVGIAAGYLNGSLQNVKVNNCTLNIGASSGRIAAYNNVSNYSLVGYATAPYLKDIKKSQFSLDVPEITHNAGGAGGSDWNASIDMETMYNNLSTLYDSSARQQYKSYEHRVNNNGTVTVVEEDSQYTNINSFTDNNVTYTYNSAESFYNTENYGNQKVASYSFAKRTDTSRYIYLYGDSNTNSTVNGGLSVKTDYTINCITDGNGNFLNSSSNTAVNNVTSFNSTTAMNNAKWTLGSDGSIKNDGRNVYLYAYSTTEVRTSTTKGTGTAYVWTYNSSNNRLSVVYNGTTYYLVYTTNNGWRLSQTISQSTVSTYTLKTSDGYYLNADWNSNNYNYTLSASTTSNNTQWNRNGDYFYINRSGTYYYLNASNQGVVRVSDSTSRRFALDSSNRLSYSSGNTRYYLYVNNGAISRSTSSYSTFSLESKISSYSNYCFMSGGAPINTTENASYNTKPTYYPLSFDSDGGVADENTGYVVSGSSNRKGDIRVSQYYTGNIGASLNITSNTNYDNTLDSHMQIISTSAAMNGNYYLIQDTHNENYTTLSNSIQNNSVGVNTTRKTVKEFGFKKYNSARNGLQSMLNGGNQIFGLHFMDALISQNSLVKVPYAKIANKDRSTLQEGDVVYNEYVNQEYEMPRDSIDFHLSSRGTINFFAGTYYSGNDTFFSLHSIERYAEDETVSGVLHKADTIKSIKQISKIYKNFYSGSDIDDEDEREAYPYTMKNSPYIYLFTDNTYSDPNAASHMTFSNNTQTLVFDMAWVTNPKMISDAVYYFEIPVNKGEFALGSVSTTSTGAYLMYLDIGAASADIDTILINEKIDKDEYGYIVPVGIDFGNAIVNGTAQVGTVTGGDTMTLLIPTGTTGSINFTYSETSTTKVLTCGPPSGSNIINGSAIKSTYKNEDLTLSAHSSIGTNGVVTVVASSTNQITTYKQTTYTYSSDTATLVKHVYYSDDPGDNMDENWVEATNEGYTTENLYDYEVLDEDIEPYAGTSPLGVFHYVILSGSDPFMYSTTTYSFSNITFDYDYKTYSYTITNYSDTPIKLYITSILKDTAEDIQYNLVINGTTYTAGAIVTINPYVEPSTDGGN